LKKGIPIVLMLLVALAATACGGRGTVSDSEPGEDGTPGVEEAVAGEARISVSPPEGWEASDSSGMLYRYQKGTASFMLKEESHFTAGTLDTVVDRARDIFDGAFENVQYTGEPESIAVGGVDASRFGFTCELGGIIMRYEYVYLIADGHVYAITFCDLGDTFDANTADFDAILRSVVIH